MVSKLIFELTIYGEVKIANIIEKEEVLFRVDALKQLKYVISEGLISTSIMKCHFKLARNA